MNLEGLQETLAEYLEKGQDPLGVIMGQEEAKKGKPVLGICNGAQILIESGIVPLDGKRVMALAPNENPIGGFRSTWVYLKMYANRGRSAFTQLYEDGEVIPIPISHAEGRYTSCDKEMMKRLVRENQVVFRYATPKGDYAKDFPDNPNGSEFGIAALSNQEGNVMAMMPHPECAIFNRQLPWTKKQPLSAMDSHAPAFKLFQSMKKYMEDSSGSKGIVIRKNEENVRFIEEHDDEGGYSNLDTIELFVRLVIPDTTAITTKFALADAGYAIEDVKRWDYYTIYVKKGTDIKALKERLRRCDVLVNANKHRAEFDLATFKYRKVIIKKRGEAGGLLTVLKKRLGFREVEAMETGTCWSLIGKEGKGLPEKEIAESILMNEHYQYAIYRE